MLQAAHAALLREKVQADDSLQQESAARAEAVAALTQAQEQCARMAASAEASVKERDSQAAAAAVRYCCSSPQHIQVVVVSNVMAV